MIERTMADQARRRSVTDRVRRAADVRGADAARIRRAVVFHRLLTRMASHGFVLKGGFCLEVRLPGHARATKDVDLVGQLALERSALRVEQALQSILDVRPSDDGFIFDVNRVRELRQPGISASAWRISLTARLDGSVFERLRVDIVGQVDEIIGGTEFLVVDPPVLIPGHEPTTLEAVDVYQHAAEKLHAYARVYAGERSSTRVKDLVDLVLLTEAGLLPDAARLRSRLDRVFEIRDGAAPPAVLPTPPATWVEDYPMLVADLTCSARTVQAAYHLIELLYRTVMTERTDP